jgi:hypothetical protein
VKGDRLVRQRVVIGQWDYTGEQLPTWVEGEVERNDLDTYLIALQRPVVVAGQPEDKLVVTGRHIGHPISNILVGPIRLWLCSLPLVARVLAPLVAANVSTPDGSRLGIAVIYLRSLFVAAGGRIPDNPA